MKTYNPEVQYDYDGTYAGMTPCEDGEWVFLEDHLAVVAENALKVKRLEVKIEVLNSTVEQLKFELACKKCAESNRRCNE